MMNCSEHSNVNRHHFLTIFYWKILWVVTIPLCRVFYIFLRIICIFYCFYCPHSWVFSYFPSRNSASFCCFLQYHPINFNDCFSILNFSTLPQTMYWANFFFFSATFEPKFWFAIKSIFSTHNFVLAIFCKSFFAALLCYFIGLK